MPQIAKRETRITKKSLDPLVDKVEALFYQLSATIAKHITMRLDYSKATLKSIQNQI